MRAGNKPIKFAAAYVLATVIYLLFDYVYMPWLAIRFEFWMVLPLYPSILIANFLGLFIYDWFQEDILFIELGRNWIDSEGEQFMTLKEFLRRSAKFSFVALSIWPSPIAGYLLLRNGVDESRWQAFKIIALGSIPCAMVWSGVAGLVVFLFRKYAFTLAWDAFVFSLILLFLTSLRRRSLA